MLTNTDFLSVGQQFPPECEKPRLHRYAENKKIFDNEHEAVYNEQWQRIEKVIGNEYIQAITTLNFQKKISLKTADFLFLEPPTYKAMRGEKEVDITPITKGLNGKGYQGAIDTSRYGTCVLKIEKDDKGKGIINLSSPEYLYTIVDEQDRKKIKGYVLAWTYTVGDEKKKQKYLHSITHYVGKIVTQTFEMKESQISALLEEKEENTGIDANLIIPIHNLLTSDSTYGIDDYMDIDSIVSEIEVRTAQINKILDTFASPSISAPVECFTKDNNGQWRFIAGNAFPSDSKDSAKPEYIVWDANLDANFKQIEKLLNYLSVISEMGVAVFTDNLDIGQLSGTALKKLYINVLAKVARVRNQFDEGLKKAIAVASQIGHEKVTEEEISITWADGLPNDEVEEADIMAKRLGNAPSATVAEMKQKYDGMTQDEAEQAADEIEGAQLNQM